MTELKRQRSNLTERLRHKARRAAARARVQFLAPAVIASGPHPIRLLAVPRDPWRGDVSAGAGLLSGRFYKAGQVLKGEETGTVVKDRWTPEALWRTTVGEGWRRWLHGFSWLRDLATVTDQAAARRIAEAHVRQWYGHHDQWSSLAWEPDILSRRILSWMTYAPLILSSNDHVHRSRVLNSLVRQARYLGLAIKAMEPGVERITAAIALVASGILLPHGEQRAVTGLTILQHELDRFILPDGGVRSRSPQDQLVVLRDLMLLEAAYVAVGESPDAILTGAMDRIVPALKAVVLGDGRLAQFNGSDEHSGNLDVLGGRFADMLSGMTAMDNGIYSGFQRLARGELVVVVDAGPPPVDADSLRHHAGTASMEFSLAGERVVVNCGTVRGLPDAALLSLGTAQELDVMTRATAAHSTLILNDTHSSQLLADGTLGDGPTVVRVNRDSDEDGAILLEVEHDGYGRRYEVEHQRRLFLSAEGLDLRGEDRMQSLAPGRRRSIPFDLRFHLHPDVTPRLLGEDEGVLLRLASGRALRFIARGAKLALEDSLYFGFAAFPRPTRQIVLSGRMSGDEHVLRWAFQVV